MMRHAIRRAACCFVPPSVLLFTLGLCFVPSIALAATVGDQVEFEVTQGAKGPQAQAVKKVTTTAP
jgi:hypothetical protein